MATMPFRDILDFVPRLSRCVNECGFLIVAAPTSKRQGVATMDETAAAILIAIATFLLTAVGTYVATFQTTRSDLMMQ
jgi:hypothetical protein